MEPKNSVNHEEKIFQVLESWEHKSAPDFFETRILSKVYSQNNSSISKINWAFLTTIIIINLIVAFKAFNTNLKNDEKLKDSAYTEYIESNSYYNQYFTPEL